MAGLPIPSQTPRLGALSWMKEVYVREGSARSSFPKVGKREFDLLACPLPLASLDGSTPDGLGVLSTLEESAL